MVLEDQIYDEVYRRLLGRSLGRQYVPFPAEFSAQEKNAVRNHINRSTFHIARVLDPITAEPANRLIRADGKIELRTSEVDEHAKAIFHSRKGESGDKTFKILQRLGYAFPRQNVRDLRKELPDVAKPVFGNRAPLIPIVADNVCHRRQIDLSDQSSYRMMKDNKEYRYALTIVDVFSRYQSIHPLETKSASGVAKEIYKVTTGHGGHLGPSTIVQSDNGGEFKESVEELLKLQNSEFLHSSPYHPQSQGKVERQQRTWKTRFFYDVRKGKTNWVEQITSYEIIHNTSPHSAFKNKYTPHQVLFGRCNNIAAKPNLAGKHEASEVRVWYEEEVERRATWLDHVSALRDDARNLSKEVDDSMVQRNLRKNPPSIYEKGETVLARVPLQVSRKQVTSVVKALIVKRYLKTHRYRIRFTAQGRAGIRQEKTLSVTDITSTTASKESRKQEESRMLAARGYFKEWADERSRAHRQQAARGHSSERSRAHQQQVVRRNRSGQPRCANASCPRPPALRCDFNKCIGCCKKSLRKCKVDSHNMPFIR